VGYLDWHDEPGYYRDITRHFPVEARVLDIGCGTSWIAKPYRTTRVSMARPTRWREPANSAGM
jgi:hypothetical protein